MYIHVLHKSIKQNRPCAAISSDTEEVTDGPTSQTFARNGAAMRVNRTGFVQRYGTGHISYRFMGCKLLEYLRLQSQALEVHAHFSWLLLLELFYNATDLKTQAKAT